MIAHRAVIFFTNQQMGRDTLKTFLFSIPSHCLSILGSLSLVIFIFFLPLYLLIGLYFYISNSVVKQFSSVNVLVCHFLLMVCFHNCAHSSAQIRNPIDWIWINMLDNTHPHTTCCHANYESICCSRFPENVGKRSLIESSKSAWGGGI